MSISTSPPPGLSVWERAIYETITAHLDAEAPLMAAYSRLAEESDSGYVQYVVAMILEDESRHHRMMQELMRALCTSVERSDDARVPGVRRVPNAAELVDVTDRLIDFEKDDRRSLRKLRREFRDVRDTTLWDVLVEAMERDTEKHLALLTFLRDRLNASMR
jgi:bacterioferritin (cytochrome b1)